MKNYVIGLRFRKYDLEEVVKVNSTDEIRPIAEKLLYKYQQKHNCFKSLQRVLVDVYFIKDILDESCGAIDYVQIYIYPQPNYEYYNITTRRYIVDKQERRKDFFETLFKLHKIAKYDKLEEIKKPLLGKR